MNKIWNLINRSSVIDMMYFTDMSSKDSKFMLMFYNIHFISILSQLIRPQLFFRTADVTGVCHLPEKVEMV